MLARFRQSERSDFQPGRPPQIELAGKLEPVRIPGLEKLTPAHTGGNCQADHRQSADSRREPREDRLSRSFVQRSGRRAFPREYLQAARHPRDRHARDPDAAAEVQRFQSS